MPARIRDIVFRSSGTGVRRAVGRFLLGTRAGATAIVAAAVAVMVIGGSALVTDHIWLVDQRDVLKSAADAAAVAATNEMNRRLISDPDMSEDALRAALDPAARKYVELNLAHLPPDRLARAKDTLVVTVTPHRNQGIVDVTATADLGGTLFSRHLPLLGSYAGPEKVGTRSAVETWVPPIEAVLAIDVSNSMITEYGDKTRMEVVKDAAKALVDILGPNEHNRVAIGVVPWHVYVRLADETATAWSTKRWARYPTRRTYGVPYGCRSTEETCAEPIAVEAQLPSSAPEDWKGCLDGHRMGSSGTHAANPAVADLFTLPWANAFSQAYYPSFFATQYECEPYDLDDLSNSRVPSDYSSTFGCYESGYARAHAPQRDCETTDPTLLPLSTIRADVIDAIDALSPTLGKTHSALGILWGQRMLLSSWRTAWGGTVHPVDPASTVGKDMRKVIVLLTDGEDSVCGTDNVACTDSPIGISRTEACAEAKRAGSEVFVVAAMPPAQMTTELETSLIACSSQSDDPDGTYVFLDNATPENLQAAFENIASQLRVVRRTH